MTSTPRFFISCWAEVTSIKIYDQPLEDLATDNNFPLISDWYLASWIKARETKQQGLRLYAHKAGLHVRRKNEHKHKYKHKPRVNRDEASTSYTRACVVRVNRPAAAAPIARDTCEQRPV